jgi:hypothetical protein
VAHGRELRSRVQLAGLVLDQLQTFAARHYEVPSSRVSAEMSLLP